MDADELKATVKTVLRISADVTMPRSKCSSTQPWKMKRVGISELAIDEGNPLVRKAVCCYCKANFGYDNSDASFFDRAYRQTVTDLMNSKANVCAGDSDG